MKSLLKLIGAFTLATTPVITVVACDNKPNEMSPKDILNSAAALITDDNLQIGADLNLAKLNLKDIETKKFSEFDSNVRTAIINFFASKLKESTDDHPTNWYHPDAHVKIVDFVVVKKEDNGKDKFVLPTGNEEVNGHLWVKAEISYLNLSTSKNIKITLNNDSSSNQDKADAIKTFIESEINKDNLNVKVENLPISGKLADIDSANTEFSFIQQNLTVAIRDKVQYSGLKLEFSFTTDKKDFSQPEKATLFTILDPTVDAKKAIVFNGNINNITITFKVGDSKSNLDIGDTTVAHTIKINQNFNDASTQITKMFSEWTVKPVAQLPTNTETYQEYSDKNKDFQTQFINDGYLVFIQRVYSNLVGKDKITADTIKITNESSKFNFNNEKNGYFSLNFELSYQLSLAFPKIDTTSVFNIDAKGVHINLRTDK